MTAREMHLLLSVVSLFALGFPFCVVAVAAAFPTASRPPKTRKLSATNGLRGNITQFIYTACRQPCSFCVSLFP